MLRRTSIAPVATFRKRADAQPKPGVQMPRFIGFFLNIDVLHADGLVLILIFRNRRFGVHLVPRFALTRGLAVIVAVVRVKSILVVMPNVDVVQDNAQDGCSRLLSAFFSEAASSAGTGRGWTTSKTASTKLVTIPASLIPSIGVQSNSMISNSLFTDSIS